METLTIEYDDQNKAVKQVINGLVSMGVFRVKEDDDEFDRDLKRSISGDELMNRLSGHIHKMFENENTISSGN
jgi:hypothetical protein